MPNDNPHEVDPTAYQKAADRFINDVKSQAKFYLVLNIVIFIVLFSIFTLGICLIIFGVIDYADQEIKVIGAGSTFSFIMIYSLLQIKSCWQCRNTCGIAIFHIDLREHNKAFEFMKESECLKGNVETLKKLMPTAA